MTEVKDGRIATPPSMVDLATAALRAMILSGRLKPGERLVENQLTDQLGVSRPPLREALKNLQHEGLVVSNPRRGAVIRPLTRHDVYEIVTLREELETFAIRLGVPARSPERLEACREALRALEEAAEAGDEGTTTQQSFDFHLAVVDLAGHSRLTDSYRNLGLQLQLCMALNREARRDGETLRANVERHRKLLTVIEEGDPQAVLDAMAHHGGSTFLFEVIDQLDGASPESEAWLAQRRAGPGE